MTTAEQVANAAKEFYNDINIDDHGRYRSWEYCYHAFYQARSAENADSDYLSLQLVDNKLIG